MLEKFSNVEIDFEVPEDVKEYPSIRDAKLTKLIIDDKIKEIVGPNGEIIINNLSNIGEMTSISPGEELILSRVEDFEEDKDNILLFKDKSDVTI